jgi:hypothetical protein
LNNIPDGAKAILAKDAQLMMHYHMTAGTKEKTEAPPKKSETSAPMAKRVTKMPAAGSNRTR